MQIQNNKSTRWLGLRSYEENDAGVFFGRDKESEQIFRMVNRETLTTIFAPSGTGKTSILKAGVFPKLREDGFLPVWIRLAHDNKLDHETFIKNLITNAAEQEGLEVSGIVPARTENESLWEFLNRVELWDQDNNLIRPVMVLDQFEETFTLGKGNDATDEFIELLSDLVERRVPNKLRRELDAAGAQQSVPLDYQGFKIIIALREDFVANLDSFRKFMPSIMHNRYRLSSLNGKQALSIVTGPGEGIVDEDVANKIVRIVAKADNDTQASNTALDKLTIEANLLSLVCHELDNARLQQSADMITADGIETTSADILSKFYVSSFDGLEPEAMYFVEENLITNKGFRDSVAVDDALENGLSPKALKQLVDQHIIRQVDRPDTNRVELTHDLLTDIVKESRDKRHQQEEKEKQRLLRKQQSKKLKVLTAATTALLMLVGVLLYSINKANIAEAESEELIRFMTIELYDELLPIGRLDLLDDVVGRAYSHIKDDVDRGIGITGVSNSDAFSVGLTLNKVANVLAKKGNVSEAADAYEKAMRMFNKSNLDNDDYYQKQSLLYQDYINFLIDWGDLSKVDRLLKQANDTSQKITDASHQSKIEQQLQFISSKILFAKGRYQDSYDKLSDLHKKLLDENITSASGVDLLFFAEIKMQLANSLAKLGIYSEAFEYAREGLKGFNKLTEQEPANEAYLYKKLTGLNQLGEYHFTVADFDGARDKFELARSIISKKLDRSASGVEASSQWYELAFDLSMNIAYSWFSELEQQANTHHDIKNYFEASNRYRAEAESFIRDQALDENTNEQLVLPKKIIAYNKLALLTNQLLSVTVQDPTLKSKLVKLADELDGEMQRYLAKVKANSKYINVAMAHTNLYRELAVHKHKFLNARDIESELESGIVLLESTAKNTPSNISLKSFLAETYLILSELQKETGQSTQSFSSMRKALEHQRSVVEVAPEIKKRRKLAVIIESLADQLMLDLSDDEYTSQAKRFLQEAHRLRINLKSSFRGEDFVRVKDQIAAGQSVYALGKILNAESSSRSFDKYLLASKLNLKEASEALAKHYKNHNHDTSKRFADLAKKQERKEFLLPTVLTDSLNVGKATSVKREALTPVLIMGQEASYGQNPQQYLTSEKLRLQHDLGLSFDKSLSKEMDSRIARVSQQAQFDLSLAEVAEHTLNYQDDRVSTSAQNLVKLHSPVLRSYPESTPTIIGYEAPLSWAYYGADGKNRNFKLQISLSEDFKKSEIERDVIVHGSQYLFKLSKSDSNLINQTFYWRVQYLSDQKVSANVDKWSAVKKFEMYDSHWARILKTGVIRVAVTQFDGDLLSMSESKVDGDAAIKLGSFDGKIIENIKKIIAKKWKQDRKLLKRADDDISELKIDPIVYGWEDMFHAVTNHEVDIAISTITRTKQREKQYAIRFTEPYHETQLVVAYKKDQAGQKTLEDILNLKLVANKGFRGAEVGELLVGDNVFPQTFANLRLLVNHVINAKDGYKGGITDATYIETRLKEERHLRKKIGVYPLQAKDYDKVITKLSHQKLKTKKTLDRLAKLKSMQKDYGTAQWEQYAIATSANDDGILLNLLNDAVLKIRQDGTVKRIAREEMLEPSNRLLGKDQKLEESLKLTTIVPVSPMNDATLSKYTDHPVLMGEQVEFSWRPLESQQNASYKIQIANSSDFSADSLVIDKLVNQPSFIVKPEQGTFINDNHFIGELYWRAKQLPAGAKQDQFPNYGWSRPIEFEYYSDVIARVKHTGKIHVALNVSNGFSVYKDDQYKHHGFDIDLMHKLAKHVSKKLGKHIKVDRTAVEFAEMFKMVQSHQADLAISGITKTIDRENRYDIKFSEPYCKTRQAIIWHKEQSQFSSPSDFIGAKIISIDKTRGLEVADYFNVNSGAEHKVIKANNKAYLLEQILNKKADATIMDYPSAIKLVADFEKRNQQTHFNIAPIHAKYFKKTKNVDKNPKDSDLEDFYAIPVHQSQAAFLQLINDGIKDIQQNDMPALKQIFKEHTVYDDARYSEPPFTLEW